VLVLFSFAFVNIIGFNSSYESHMDWGATVIDLPSYRHGWPLPYLERDAQFRTDGQIAPTGRFPCDNALVHYCSTTNLGLDLLFASIATGILSTLTRRGL